MYLIQVLLAGLVFFEILREPAEPWGTLPSSVWIVFARFVCGIVLHVQLSAELYQGLTMMKFAVNHPWKFEDYKVAYAVGFMQMSMVVIVEFVNFVALITNNAVLDVVMNFLALVVIAEFDDYFYESSDYPEL